MYFGNSSRTQTKSRRSFNQFILYWIISKLQKQNASSTKAPGAGGIATEWTGVVMSTPVLPQGLPKFDSLQVRRVSGSEGGRSGTKFAAFLHSFQSSRLLTAEICLQLFNVAHDSLKVKRTANTTQTQNAPKYTN